MLAKELILSGVFLLEPKIFADSRGFFMESFNKKKFEEIIKRDINFVQDNQSKSIKNVLRGLHYQTKHTQGKLVRALNGAIFDVVVDIRTGSKTFGQWLGVLLSSENKKQLWVPEGFAHGFLVLSKEAEILYKTTDYYSPNHECSILWSDPKIAIQWPLNGETPILSDKDCNGLLIDQITPL